MTPHEFLHDMLLLEHSKAQTMRIVHWIGADAERLAALIDIFLGDEYRLTQRSAWVVRYVGESHPDMMKPYYPMLLEALNRQPVHDAVKRNTLNVFEDVEIPTEYYDALADHCFNYLADPKEPIAVRCASMTILEKITRQIPELREELRLLLEEQSEFESAGIRSRAKKTLLRVMRDEL
ncbi:MAG: hypothetical protein JNM22_04255 [Saprospiraceae bacterium]|nr:hypothetical protein [Saprospiraceae bacterium]